MIEYLVTQRVRVGSRHLPLPLAKDGVGFGCGLNMIVNIMLAICEGYMLVRRHHSALMAAAFFARMAFWRLLPSNAVPHSASIRPPTPKL